VIVGVSTAQPAQHVLKIISQDVKPAQHLRVRPLRLGEKKKKSRWWPLASATVESCRAHHQRR
jgi:hypothetical protein